MNDCRPERIGTVRVKADSATAAHVESKAQRVPGIGVRREYKAGPAQIGNGVGAWDDVE